MSSIQLHSDQCGQRKCVAVIFLLVSCLSSINCSGDYKNFRKKREKTVVIEDSGSEDGRFGENPIEDSLGGFKEALYPLLVTNCESCHSTQRSPFIASKSPDESHLQIIRTGLVSFLAPDKSRLAKKIGELEHYCWSECSTDAASIVDGIETWKKKISPDSIEKLLQEAKKNTTAGISFTESIDIPNPNADPNTILLEAEDAVLTSPMVKKFSADASGKSYIFTPNQGTLREVNDPTSGKAVFSFEIKESGIYTIWGLINGPRPEENSFYCSIDSGVFDSWDTGITFENKFKWDQVNNTVEGSDLKYQLSKGSHEITLKEREDGTKIDGIAITKNPDFTGSEIIPSYLKILSFDLSEITGYPSLFTIQWRQFDEFSYEFVNPKLTTTEKNVKIKGIRVLVNDIFDTQNSTFTVIDTTIAIPGGLPLSDASMIVPVDVSANEDRISIQFEEISVIE